MYPDVLRSRSDPGTTFKIVTVIDKRGYCVTLEEHRSRRQNKSCGSCPSCTPTGCYLRTLPYFSTTWQLLRNWKTTHLKPLNHSGRMKVLQFKQLDENSSKKKKCSTFRGSRVELGFRVGPCQNFLTLFLHVFLSSLVRGPSVGRHRPSLVHTTLSLEFQEDPSSFRHRPFLVY